MPASYLASQTIYYPANSSQVLRATAADLATLLQRAASDTSTRFTTQAYGNALPATGIILIYDSSITDNQLCRVAGDGISRLLFTAAEDNGLVFGAYQYLHELGFKFYQPGTAWEVIPNLSTVFKKLDKTYNTAFKYKSWFISGGHRTWIMDKVTTYNWEQYIGENGHNWSLYQRRNGMLGAYRFAGHRGDIVNGSYLATLQTNPCYVASFNGSRQATNSSVPDIYNNAALQLWSGTIEQKYTQTRNSILNNRVLYVNQYRSFKYNNEYVGIEVPDGPRWGNSRDSIGCSSIDYMPEADQSITLANSTAKKIKAVYSSRRFQVYGYSTHANAPSAGINIDTSIDVQVVATAFQSETSAKGLLNRWYKKYSAVSEYHYMNIPQWSGETPMMYLSELNQVLLRLKENHSQGIVWEASPAKFSSLPFLLAANEYLINGIPTDTLLREFCVEMFGPASSPVYELLHEWSSDGAITMGYYAKDNKYKIPRYLQLLSEATRLGSGAGGLVPQRLDELKAYLHYIILYYQWFADDRPIEEKRPEGATLCLYLAKINKMQLVNSYYLITGIAARYGTTSSFFSEYNVQTGTAYQNGDLALISPAEIEANYQDDMNRLSGLIRTYAFETDKKLAGRVVSGNFLPAGTIKVNLGTTYTNRFVFNIYAPVPGSFTIRFTAQIGAAAKSSMNIAVDDAQKALGVVMDTSFTDLSGNGRLDVQLPAAGFYTLVVSTKYASSINMDITTNGNAFYKNTAFTHRYAEKYTADPASLPGFFFVPAGMERVYFSVNNSYSAGRYLTATQVGNEFVVKDIYGNKVMPIPAEGGDQSLFYINIPPGQSGNFWQISRMGQYFICFANISNILWYGSRKMCAPADFSVSVVRTAGGDCITKLSTNGSENIRWKVEDGGTVYNYTTTKEVLLPATISPSSIVTLVLSNTCSVTKRLSQDADYLRQLEACASGGPLLPAADPGTLRLYPNPSPGIFKVEMPGSDRVPGAISIFDVSGKRMKVYYNVCTLDLTGFSAGVYYYEIMSGSNKYRGKLLKL
jgi:hypothetical protein